MLYSKRLTCAAAVLGIMAVGNATAALASPGSGTTPENLATANLAEGDHVNNDRIKFQTKGATIVRVQKLTFAPGAYTGWHHHPGVVIVAVSSGSVTLTESNCSSTTTYGPGSVFVEGDDHAHQASSTGGATVYVTYVVPSASPPVFRIEDQVPFCATSF